MTNRREWHFIVESSPKKGSWNMAVDDYLFQTLGETPATVLRFYRWERPTVSLGYAQKASRVADLEFCRQNGIDIVRRITGGKLVLHAQEVTYSVCSSDAEVFPLRVRDSYRMISEALITGLRSMGVLCALSQDTPSSYARGHGPCFSRPARDEIMVSGKKLVGSAQKRSGSVFLQHGSIPLEKDEDLLRRVSRIEPNEEADLHMTSLSEILGRRTHFAWVVEHLKKGFSDRFGVRFREKRFTREEKLRILSIQREKYENPSWTFRMHQG